MEHIGSLATGPRERERDKERERERERENWKLRERKSGRAYNGSARMVHPAQAVYAFSIFSRQLACNFIPDQLDARPM
jgi:hypothetical protein